MKPEEFSAFLARYFPSFLLCFFGAVFGISINVAIWGMQHWHDPAQSGWYSLMLGGALGVILSVGHFFMIRGYAWAVYPIWAVLIVTLLTGLSLFGSRVPPLLLGAGLALPLLAMLVFNGKRHREMRALLIDLGIKRRSA